MNISALLTSAGINIGLCALFLSLYSILRKQPSNFIVYFGRRLSEERKYNYSFSLDRFVPSAGWIVKAWALTEDEILLIAGLDAVVFLRILVFSIRIFSIVSAVCVFAVLPLNYFGKEMKHQMIPSESLEVFTIANVQEGSRWLWVHCLALYIISMSACALLYFAVYSGLEEFRGRQLVSRIMARPSLVHSYVGRGFCQEYKNISRMRLAHIIISPPNPSHFSVLVRSIPRNRDEPFDVTIVNFFTKYHGSSYLSHQMIYRAGTVQKIMAWAKILNYVNANAKKVCKKIVRLKATGFDEKHRSNNYRCGLCGGMPRTFQMYHNEFELDAKREELDSSVSSKIKKECSAAFVFFKTRYAAVVASQILQSSNPMLWATNLAPEPHDVYWSNLWISYNLLWFRRIAVRIATVVFMFLFLVPVTFVQGLSQLDKLQHKLPFLKGILEKRTFVIELVTGYLPSVILMLSLYTVPPMMMLFSGIEGPISHSGKRRSACCKLLFFTIWNIFFVNVFSGSVIGNIISSPKDIPTELAKAVPEQATFFITYVLTSGWASLFAELLQIFALIWNFLKKILYRSEDNPDSVPSFPYYTEVPKVLLFGLIGFTCAILAPLILPFLLLYFSFGFLVYRNQIWNVYRTKYESGGQIWPLVHNTTIFSLVLTQVIALGVFGIKKSPVASGFTIPLLIFTVLFSEACRHRFGPIFSKLSAQDLIEMDQRDEQSGRMEEIHRQLLSAYCQHPPDTDVYCPPNTASLSLDLSENGGPVTLEGTGSNCQEFKAI